MTWQPLTCVVTASYEHFVTGFGRERTYRRNVKIKTSERCLPCVFITVGTLILLQSTTSYRPRSLTRNESTGRRISYTGPANHVRKTRQFVCRRRNDTSSSPQSRPDRRPRVLTAHRQPPRGKTIVLVRHQRCRCRRRKFHGC